MVVPECGRAPSQIEVTICLPLRRGTIMTHREQTETEQGMSSGFQPVVTVYHDFVVYMAHTVQ